MILCGIYEHTDSTIYLPFNSCIAFAASETDANFTNPQLCVREGSFDFKIARLSISPKVLNILINHELIHLWHAYLTQGFLCHRLGKFGNKKLHGNPNFVGHAYLAKIFSIAPLLPEFGERWLWRLYEILTLPERALMIPVLHTGPHFPLVIL